MELRSNSPCACVAKAVPAQTSSREGTLTLRQWLCDDGLGISTPISMRYLEFADFLRTGCAEGEYTVCTACLVCVRQATRQACTAYMHDHRRVHVLQHVQDGFEKPLDDHGLPALAPKIRSHYFDIGALSWCDSHRLISLDSSCSSKREPGCFCRNLLLFPFGSVCDRTQASAFAVFLQLADSWYLQNFDTAEVTFTLTVVNRVNPEGSISKGMTPAPERHVFHVISWLMETQQPLHLYADVASVEASW